MDIVEYIEIIEKLMGRKLYEHEKKTLEFFTKSPKDAIALMTSRGPVWYDRYGIVIEIE